MQYEETDDVTYPYLGDDAEAGYEGRVTNSGTYRIDANMSNPNLGLAIQAPERSLALLDQGRDRGCRERGF